MENYEFCVQVWFEDGTWNYSIVQEFEFPDGEEVEVLAYGDAPTRQDAISYVGQELSNIQF